MLIRNKRGNKKVRHDNRNNRKRWKKARKTAGEKYEKEKNNELLLDNDVQKLKAVK